MAKNKISPNFCHVFIPYHGNILINKGHRLILSSPLPRVEIHENQPHPTS